MKSHITRLEKRFFCVCIVLLCQVIFEELISIEIQPSYAQIQWHSKEGGSQYLYIWFIYI